MSTEVLLEILKWLTLLLLLLMLFRLFTSLANEAQKEHKQAFGGGTGQSGSGMDNIPTTPDGLSEYQKRERERKAKQVKRILKKDKTFASDLSRLAGTGHLPMDKLLEDPDAIAQLADRLGDNILNILDVASDDAVIDMDLESKRVRRETTVGELAEVGRIRSLADMARRRPYEYALPKPIRNRRLLTGQAQMMRRYEMVNIKKMFAVLEDGSGSMMEPMSDGKAKYIRARGVIVKLTRQAIEGKSRFIYRMFDDEPHKAFKATNPAEAQRFMDEVALRLAPSQGGTNIYNAFSQAVKDINSDPTITDADILIVSDGQDSSMDDLDKVRKKLGKKIKLHVIMIGGENPALKKVATTYRVFQ